MILRAQWAGSVFLLADGVVVSKGEAVLAVRCSRSSVEYRDTMSNGEESNRIAQNSGVLWGESDDNRRCCLALMFAGVGGEKPDLLRRDLPGIGKSFRHDFKEHFFVLEGAKFLEEIEGDSMYGAVDAGGGELESFEGVLFKFQLLIQEIRQLVKEGGVNFSGGELICRKGDCASFVRSGHEGEGCPVLPSV